MKTKREVGNMSKKTMGLVWCSLTALLGFSSGILFETRLFLLTNILFVISWIMLFKNLGGFEIILKRGSK